MILFLDTSGFDYLKFALAPDQAGGRAIQQRIKIHHFDSERTLPALWQFLKESSVEISKIYIVSGPGSFSGLRVGASIALAFGFAWNVPVYALKANNVPKKLADLAKAKVEKINSDFEPDYGQAPKITKEKPKKLKNT